MKQFRVAEARARFGEILDEADQGETVIIERRGVRYRLTSEPAARRTSRKRQSPFEWVDPAVMSGQWTWNLGPNGLEFVDLRPTRTRKRR